MHGRITCTLSASSVTLTAHVGLQAIALIRLRTRAARACGTACDCRQRPARGASSENALFMTVLLQFGLTGEADGREEVCAEQSRHTRTLAAWKGPFVTRPKSSAFGISELLEVNTHRPMAQALLR